MDAVCGSVLVMVACMTVCVFPEIIFLPIYAAIRLVEWWQEAERQWAEDMKNK